MLSQAVVAVAAALAAGPAFASPTFNAFAAESCPTTGAISCQNTTAQSNLCCFESPGGQILQTQFWDTDPTTGPSDSWTIHGLWPDNCDGTFQATCDPDRQYTNISDILSAAGATATLSYMNTYWKDIDGDDESFWEHEWGKHGTCMSTFDPSCYSNYQTGDEVVDFFNTAVATFKTLPSYTWLTAAGIVPSTSKTYTLSAIQAALKAHHGHDVIINCDGDTFNELWYQFNVQGSVQDGKLIAVDPVGEGSTCPDSGIKWVPKSGGSGGSGPTSTSSAPGSGPTGPAGQLSGPGFVEVSSGGFLISGGEWYNGGGTPATYQATPSTGKTFTLSTSKGDCGIASGALSCASGVTAAKFGYDGTSLTYNGKNTFFAASTPSGDTQGTVYTSSHSVSIKLAWSAQ